MFIEQQMKIRIVYRSGYTHDFYVTNFTMNAGQYAWNACDLTNKPVIIGVDDIAAVYLVGNRYRFKFRAK